MASAELFKVTCVTCQSHLSVRNAALIGQIVGCPKCNSMVEIAPPATATPTKPLAAAVAPVVAQPSFEEPLGSFVEPATVEPASPASLTDDPVGSVLATSSSSSAKFIIWAVASFVIGATLTGAFLVLRSGGSAEEVAAVETKIAPVNEQPKTPPVAEESTTEAAPPKKTSPDIAKKSKTPADDNPFEVQPEPAEPPLLGVIEEPIAEVAVAEPAVTATEEAPEQKLVIESPAEPRIARKFDPLALDPEELSLNALSEAGTADAENAAPADEAVPQEIEPQPVPPLANVSKVVRLNEKSGGASRSRSAEIQLNRELPALTLKDMPLLDFLNLVSQLAGVPVSIAPDQLLMAGITPGRPVSLDTSANRLADALSAVLKPLHLEATTDGPQVVIVRKDAAKVRSVDYPIDDLLGNKTTAAEFAIWIEKLIAPESWQANGGDGKITLSEKSLQVEQTQAVQYQVLFFLERIRLAKQLPLRSRYPERLLAAKPLSVGIADRLAAPTTFTFSHDTPLAEVFHYWQGEAGLPIFVDWPALASVDLWLDSQVTCAITNEPWQTALDTVLAPLNLGWRPAPGGGIQVTSRARIETEPQLDIYPAGAWQGDAADATVINDTVNKLTYVRASAAAHRQ
ncbi:MAG: hypothetical protein SH868_07435 [Bythopirellula sp.]|nr:hypothetical protein [Bythopirellula sp.]